MKNTLKIHLTSFVLPFVFIGCVMEPPENVLTEVYGTVNTTENCTGSNIHIISDELSGLWVDGVYPVNSNGNFYAAFSGGDIIGLEGNEFCGSSYQFLEIGKRREYNLTFQPVKSDILFIYDSRKLPQGVRLYYMKLTRLVETRENKLRPLNSDFHNIIEYFSYYAGDTTINLTLVDQERYLFNVVGLDSSNKSIELKKDTITVNEDLSEIVF